MLDFIFTVVNAFDWGVSFVSSIFQMSYLDAVDTIFNNINGEVFEFVSLMHDAIYEFTFPYFPAVSETVSTVFLTLYGWASTVFGNTYFGVVIIVGTFGNFIFISLIHWIIKLVGAVFVP